jgi:squalene-hopene/tetraprenyl-beta-curcumene cyclase
MQETIKRATDTLLRLQRPDGSWSGRLQVNPAPSADLLMLHRYYGLNVRDIADKVVPPILEEQNPDGGWSAYPGSLSDLDTSAEIALGLSLCEKPPADALKQARQFIRAHGGVGNTFFTIQSLYALFNQLPWNKVRRIPLWLIWLPHGIGLESLPSWARLLSLCFLLMGDQGKSRPLARQSRRKAIEILRSIQDRNGGWYGMFTPTFLALMALRRQGFRASDPMVQWGFRFIESLQARQSNGVTQERYRSEIWDTALALHTLRTGGLPDDHPAVMRAVDYLAPQQIWHPVTPKWASKRPVGGWSFEDSNTLFPDADDTAAAVIALAKLRNERGTEIERQAFRGVGWLLRQQNPHGGLGAFDKEARGGLLEWGARTRGMMYTADRRWMWYCRSRDMATPDVTGHALEAMMTGGLTSAHRAVDSAVDFLISAQTKSGAWRGRWGVGPIYGTYMALRGLRSARLSRSYSFIAKAVDWLKSVQLPDRGWGEPPESFVSKDLWGAGPSNPTQTAWAIMGLAYAGEVESEEVSQGVEYLIRTQTDRGFWDEPHPTGVLMPPDSFLSYELYPLIFPLMALVKVRKAKEAIIR